MSKYKLCRGFKDLLPYDYKKIIFLKESIEEIANLYSYKMVDTPCVEQTSLFMSNYKKDIYNRLFRIERKFTNSVCLNYDSTISILRSVVENKLYVDKSLPLKLMYLKEVYDYDKLDTSVVSRYEYGFECVCAKSVYLDVENILLIKKVLNYLGLYGIKLRINNLSENNQYYFTFKQSLTNLDIGYEEDKSVRGKGYYTGIVYEIDIDNDHKVVRGGRYDNLIESIGGVSVDCVGMHINFDLLINIMDKNELFPDFKEEVDFYVVPVGEKTFKYGLYVSELLRDLGAVVEIHYQEYDLKRLDSLLDRVDMTYSVVIEEEDIAKETIKVRNAHSKEQKVVVLKDFIEDLKNLSKHHHEEE